MSKFDTAKLRLVFEQPFFASILMKHPVRETSLIPTAAVSPDGTIYYNKQFMESLTEDETMFVLAHEVMHIVCLHALRKGDRDHKLWNVAGDLYINDFLKASGFTVLKEGLMKAGSKDKTTEEIYEELLQKKGMPRRGKGKGPKKPGGPDDGKGYGGDPDEEEDSKDDLADDVLPEDHELSGKPMTEAEKKAKEYEQKLENIEAVKTAKNMGKLPGGLDRLVKDLLKVKTPWHEIMARFVTAKSAQSISWDRPNRRYSDWYLPSRKPEPSMGELVIGIDTSGSISNRELTEFYSHVKAVLETCHPAKTYVVYCDTNINRVDEFEDELPEGLHGVGGGGTDMPEILKWVEDNGVDPDCALILTDGYTEFAEAPYPVLWCITSDIVSPYGETVKVETE